MSDTHPGNGTVYFWPFGNGQADDKRNLADVATDLITAAKHAAKRDTAHPITGKESPEVTRVDFEAAQLLLRQLKAATWAKDIGLNGSLARRLLNKDKELFGLLAMLQIFFSKLEWVLYCSVATPEQQQEYRILVNKLRELAPPLGERVYRSPRKKPKTS